jgi:hypothetical protein
MIEFPLSIVGAEGEIAPAVMSGYTVTASLAEHCETGEKAESVAW